MEQNKEGSLLKNVARRTSQLGLIVLFVSLGITAYYFMLGLNTSAVMVLCFSVSITVILVLQYVGVIEQAQSLILTAICTLLVISAFVEGSATGQYFYFFPVIVVIPVIVDYKNSSNLEFVVSYAMVITSFAACFYIGHTHRPFESISPEVNNQMLFANAGSAILLTLVFSCAYIFYEKNHLKAILNEKNKAITARTKFLSTMGHELRTPLNGIIGALNIVQDGQDEFCKNEYFPILKYCSNHMLQLINDMLDFNKIEADKLSIHPIEVNLKQLLINSTLPFYNHIEEKNLQLIVEVDPALDTIVMVDDVRLIQILNNLLSNAMKFTEHGFIKLIAKCNQIDAGLISVLFFVEDSGIGIVKEDQHKIFETFGQVFNESSRKYNGTGLGLTICLRLLQLMGSSLELISETKKGSTFSFNLNLIRPATKLEKIENAVAKAESLSGLKILIVEDNQINMMIVKKMLSVEQAICSCTYNGKEALELLRGDGAFDMILLDLEMPVMDGYAAIKEIKLLYPQIPVIAFTASLIDNETLSYLMSIGFEDCIIKPFQPQHLFAQIKKYCRGALISNVAPAGQNA